MTAISHTLNTFHSGAGIDSCSLVCLPPATHSWCCTASVNILAYDGLLYINRYEANYEARKSVGRAARGGYGFGPAFGKGMRVPILAGSAGTWLD